MAKGWADDTWENTGIKLRRLAAFQKTDGQTAGFVHGVHRYAPGAHPLLWAGVGVAVSAGVVGWGLNRGGLIRLLIQGWLGGALVGSVVTTLIALRGATCLSMDALSRGSTAEYTLDAGLFFESLMIMCVLSGNAYLPGVWIGWASVMAAAYQMQKAQHGYQNNLSNPYVADKPLALKDLKNKIRPSSQVVYKTEKEVESKINSASIDQIVRLFEDGFQDFSSCIKNACIAEPRDCILNTTFHRWEKENFASKNKTVLQIARGAFCLYLDAREARWDFYTNASVEKKLESHIGAYIKEIKAIHSKALYAMDPKAFEKFILKNDKLNMSEVELVELAVDWLKNHELFEKEEKTSDFLYGCFTKDLFRRTNNNCIASWIRTKDLDKNDQQAMRSIFEDGSTHIGEDRFNGIFSKMDSRRAPRQVYWSLDNKEGNQKIHWKPCSDPTKDFDENGRAVTATYDLQGGQVVDLRLSCFSPWIKKNHLGEVRLDIGFKSDEGPGSSKKQEACPPQLDVTIKFEYIEGHGSNKGYTLKSDPCLDVVHNKQGRGGSFRVLSLSSPDFSEALFDNLQRGVPIADVFITLHPEKICKTVNTQCFVCKSGSLMKQ